MKLAPQLTTVRFWRLTVQWAFFAWILFIGVQFGRFVYHFTSGGQGAFVNLAHRELKASCPSALWLAPSFGP